MRYLVLLVFVFTVLAVLGCSPPEDKAKADYERCLALEKSGDFGGAYGACMTSYNLDSRSPSGEAAHGKVKDLEAKMKAAEKQKAEADAAERPRLLAAARKNVSKSYSPPRGEKDSECVDKGLPPYKWNYESAPRSEIDLVANADGCRHLFDNSDLFLFKVFCCSNP